MAVLFLYLFLAVGISFLCSIFEAVLLSVTPAFVSIQKKEKKRLGQQLARMKEDINQPLAAILSLNTMAHTIGAAGTGAEAARIFGDAYLGVISGVLTLIILVFSEIIPKTLGARYWRQLTPVTVFCLRYLLWAFYPFVKLSHWLTMGIKEGPEIKGFSREEFRAMADLSRAEGQLGEQENRMLKSLLMAHGRLVSEILTPRTVVFSVPHDLSVKAFMEEHDAERFSRIPVYKDDPEHLVGFVLRSDLLLAHARGEGERPVFDFVRELSGVSETTSVTKAFKKCLTDREQILQVIDEHGGLKGILTLEDVIETLLGLEIVDEGDKITDMQKLAKRRWRFRLRELKKNPLKRG